VEQDQQGKAEGQTFSNISLPTKSKIKQKKKASDV
jgi:hypothetical protein